MAGKYSILDMINSKSRQAAGAANDYMEIYLSPYDVKEAPENTHKECKDIEALADNFLLVGQEAPTTLGRVNGEYRIVDGHRRNRANIYNLERGYTQFEKVRFLYKDMSEIMYELSLLSGNGYTQELTDYEKTELAERLKKALKKAIEAGEIEKQGDLRDIVGMMIGEKSTNMARIEKINSSLTEEAREQFKDGKMGISAAYETARLPEEEQKEIAAKMAAGEKLEAKDIAERVKERQAKEEPTVGDIEKLYRYLNYGKRQQTAEELKTEYGKTHSGGNSMGIDFQCSPRGISLNGSAEITWKRAIVKLEEERSRKEALQATAEAAARAEAAAEKAVKAAEKSKDSGIAAAQAAVSAERAAESADMSASQFDGAMNAPVAEMSDSDICKQENTEEWTTRDWAIYTLRQLLLVASEITDDDLLVLQDILVAANGRAGANGK